MFKTWARKIYIGILSLFIVNGAYAVTCQSNEFEYDGQCIENKFQITTTNDTDRFVFTMTAKGTFYIDWGDGNVELIDRANTTAKTEYSHDYASANEYIIKFGGRATGYNTTRSTSVGGAIVFGLYRNATTTVATTNNTYDKVAGISGSLGAIFPTIGTGTTAATQPIFIHTFGGCSNLTSSIPSTLFSGLSGIPATYMFYGTFYGCSGLTDTDIDDPNNPGKKYAIPPTLFAGISGAPATNMFFMTFRECSGLTGTMPGNLFSGISGAPTSYMFYGLFWGCTGLTGSIPANLFSGIYGKPATAMFQYTFASCRNLSGTDIDDPDQPGYKYAIPPTLFAGIIGDVSAATAFFMGTFESCSKLTGTIPAGLFGGIKGSPRTSMFHNTFQSCTNLTGSIPATLFSGISGKPASSMFRNTFMTCRNLTGPIPSNLFAGISGAPAIYMFSGTFANCSRLTGSIPGNLFSGVSGAPASNMFYETFYGCSGLTGTDIDDPDQPGYKYAIPPTLFSGVSGAPAYMMYNTTFNNCSGLSGTIPGNLFAGISGAPAYAIFNMTFKGCSNLTGSIPASLFAGIVGKPTQYMFYTTFGNCSKLTGPIPPNLFAGIIGKGYSDMFTYTFNGCTNLGKDAIGGTSRYYIPPELFAGIDKTSVSSGMMTGVFGYTGLLTTCPTGTTQYTTGFESWFSGKQSCTECPVAYPDYDTTNQQCYAQVTFIDSDDNTLLKTEDVYYDANNPNGFTLPSYSPTKPDTILDNWTTGDGTVIGSADLLTGNQVVYSDWGFHCDSGHYFHAGNEQICTAETKRTTYALVIKPDANHTYYIHATPNSEHDYTINSSSIHKMKVNYNGTIYNLHDASVYFSE